MQTIPAHPTTHIDDLSQVFRVEAVPHSCVHAFAQCQVGAEVDVVVNKLCGKAGAGVAAEKHVLGFAVPVDVWSGDLED